MTADNQSGSERRQFPRLELAGDVEALDSQGRLIGRVELVSAGGMRVRVAAEADHRMFTTGAQFEISLLENGADERRVQVEVRSYVADVLGVKFIHYPS